MLDATGFLIEIPDSEDGTRYEHIADHERAIEYLRQLVGQGKTAILYQRVDFTVKVDVTVKAPRKRRKTPPPADKPGSDAPSGPGNGEAGEHERGCVVPRGDGLAMTRGTAGFDMAPDSTSQPATAGTNPASPVLLSPPVDLWACEVDRYAGDPPCPGPILYDPATRGRFCAVHMVPEVSVRAEWHRRNAARNRPLRIAG